MNIVFFSPIEVFPIDGGAPNRIFNLAKSIADRGENVYIIVLNSRTQGTVRLGNLNVVTYAFPKIPVGGWTLGILKLVKGLGNITEQIDVIQCEFPYLFPWTFLAKTLHGSPPIVLDEHGVEINYVREVYIKKPKVRTIASTFVQEYVALRFSSHTFTCSRLDSEQISRIYKVPSGKITEIPNAVSEEFLHEVEPHRFGKPTILFLGGFRHPPNLRSARVIKDVIVPMVTRTERNAQFVFVGQEPPSWLGDTEHIQALGYVPDVRPLIKGANVCIAPILQGSGTRLKILEYMALGKPVVATSKGAEGIQATHDTDIIIEDDLQRFSEHILHLLSDTGKADRLGQSARRIVEEKYTWKKVSEKAIEVYQELSARRL